MKFSRPDYTERIVDTAGKIPQDEPCFLLRAQDELAPRLLLMWAMEVRLRGGDPVMASEAESHAQEMISWQKTHRVKTPDMYQDSEYRKNLLKSIKSELTNLTPGKISKFMDLLKEYYGPDVSNVIQILLPIDLKAPSYDGTSLDHFNINLEVTNRCKIVLYSTKLGKINILKSEL